MIDLKASEIAKIVNGKLIGDDVLVTSAPVFNSTNSVTGSIFLALVGEKVDGHSFIKDAFERGALLALVTREVEERCIIVDDVVAALGALASYVRNSLPDLVVIGITGSQGKTTTKDLLRHILENVGKTVAPIGNYNNEIGAPLTLLHCDRSTRYCILEMGARHIGDIAALCKMARPNFGVVLKVGSAHLGEFGSEAAIAQTKSEMISSLEDQATAILGQYDPFTIAMSSLHNGNTLTFGETAKSDVRATDIDVREGRPHFDLVTPAGRAAVGLRIVGVHQVANALAAAAVATALGISIEVIASGLSTAELDSKWRMEVRELKDLILINDSYNSSPEAAAAALRTLILFAQEQGGNSWAFLGKMHELGASSPAAHAAIGTLASEVGVDHLVCIGADEYVSEIGPNSQMTTHLFKEKPDALLLINQIKPGDVVLVKASRSEAFEEVALEIEKRWNERISEEVGDQE